MKVDRIGNYVRLSEDDAVVEPWGVWWNPAYGDGVKLTWADIETLYALRNEELAAKAEGNVAG
jgi:hypothetical protein